MIFGAGRQISSLQEKIRELEAERNLLSNQVEQAHAEQSQLEEKNSLLHRQILELERTCSEQNKRCLELQDDLDKEKMTVSRVQQERDTLRKELSGLLEVKNELTQSVHALSYQVNAYEHMTPEQFLNWGADHFTLDQLSLILEKAQSKAFIRVRMEQKKAYIQQIVNILTCVKFPVSNELSLLRLLRMMDQESAVSLVEMEETIMSLPVANVLAAHSGHYNRMEITQKHQAVPKYCFEARTPNEYAKKAAVCSLVDVLGQIVEKFS